nr:DUF6774 domain-containing protein [uncultured Oscillibacter sp.]
MNNNGCDPLALTTAVNTLAAAVASRLDDRDLALTAAILVQLGDTLATIAAQRARCAVPQPGK